MGRDGEVVKTGGSWRCSKYGYVTINLNQLNPNIQTPFFANCGMFI